MRLGRTLTIAVTVAVLAAPASAWAAGSGSTLSLQTPSFVTKTSAAPAVKTPTTGTPAPSQLPRTGDDLLLELVVAGGLLGVGLALRVRSRDQRLGRGN